MNKVSGISKLLFNWPIGSHKVALVWLNMLDPGPNYEI